MKHPLVIDIVWHEFYEYGQTLVNNIFTELIRDVNRSMKRGYILDF